MTLKLLMSVFLFITSLYGLSFMRRCIRYKIDNSIIASTTIVTVIGSFMGYIFIGSKCISEAINARFTDEPLILISLFVVFIIASLMLNAFMSKGYFIELNKYESSLFEFIEESTFFNNPLTERVSNICLVFIIIAGIIGTFSSGVEVLEPAGKTSKEIQIVGVLKEPGYTDSRGYEEKPQYSISYKLLDENHTRTLNNDNCEIDKLEEYYQAFKNNIESIYTANMSVSKSKKNPDNKSYDLIDIIHNERIEAK